MEWLVGYRSTRYTRLMVEFSCWDKGAHEYQSIIIKTITFIPDILYPKKTISLAARTATSCQSWTAAIPAVVVENSHPSLPDERQAMVPCLLDCIQQPCRANPPCAFSTRDAVMSPLRGGRDRPFKAGPLYSFGCPETMPTIAHDIPKNGWFIPQHCKFLQDDQQNGSSCRIVSAVFHCQIADQFSDKRIPQSA